VIKYFLQPFLRNDEFLEFSRSIDSSLGLQGLALLCTALYQTVRQQLTLFHAICCIHLLALLGIDLSSRGRYAGFGKSRLIVMTTVNVLATCAFIAFNVYVWVTAPKFGSQPQCNSSTVYVVFGVSINATAPIFRWIILATMALGPALIICILLIMLPCFLCIWWKGRGEWRRTAPDPTFDEMMSRPERITRHVLAILANMAFCIYAIVSLEQTISRNNLSPDERQWTFGQIVALFLLLGVGNEMLNILLAHWDDRKAESSEREEANSP
jgi:hypothetical protein